MEKRELIIISVGILFLMSGLFLILNEQGVITGQAVFMPNECPSGMVSYWKLDDANGTNAADSIDGNNGSVVGPTWTTGVVEGALDFDGVDDYVDLNNLDITSSGFTIAGWFKADDFGYADSRIISKATDQAEQDHYWMLSTIHSGGQKRLRFRLKTGTDPSTGTTTLIASSGAVPTGTWVHATAVYDGSKMYLYKDGALVGSTTKTGTVATNASVDAWIGDNPGPTRKAFDGMIDEVVLFDRALSANEVSRLYGDTRFGLYDYCPVVHDHGSVNLYYNGTSTVLSVWGEAPIGAETARVEVRTIGGTEVYAQNTSVTFDGDNANVYREDIDVGAWDPEKYNVLVEFYDDAGYMTGYDAGDLFDNLFILMLDMRIGELEEWVSMLDVDLYDLLGKVGNNSYNISVLFDITNEINANLTLVWAEFDDLRTVIGDINMSLSALTTRVDSLNATVTELMDLLSDVESRVEMMNHATINLYHIGGRWYDPVQHQLFVWGEAPIGATEAHVQIHNTRITWTDIFFGVTPIMEVTVPVVNNGNLNAYEAVIHTRHLDPIKYNVMVEFHDGVAKMHDYGVSALFDDLLLIDLAERLDDVEEDLYGDDRNELMNSIRADYCDWKEAKGETSGSSYTRYCPWGFFDAIRWWDMLDDYGYEDTLYWTMRNHYLDSAQLWNEIDIIWNDVDYLHYALFGLERDQFMNQARLAWCDWKVTLGETGNKYKRYCTGTFGNPSDNWEDAMADHGYDDMLLITSKNLYEDNVDQWNEISDLWAELEDVWLAIDELFAWLEDLQERVEDQDHGTINTFYYNDQASWFTRNTLYVWGEAPYEATKAKVAIRDNEGDYILQETDSNLDASWSNSNPSSYWVDFDTDDLEPKPYNVRTRFYRGHRYMGRAYDVSTSFDDLILEDLMYGFNNIVFTSRVETYFEPTATVPITYTFRTDESSWLFPAGIWIKDEDKGFYRLLRVTYVQSDTRYRFTDYVTFNEIGEYDLKLEARHGVILPWIFESTEFNTDVVALEDYVPNSTLELVLPDNWGNIHSTPPNPDADDVSWHQSGLISMKAMLGANTPPADTACDVYYYSNRDYSELVSAGLEPSDLGRLFLSGLAIREEEMEPPIVIDTGGDPEPEPGVVKYCSDDILSTMMDEGDEGVYQLEVEQEFISSFDQMDLIRIGIDDTPPIIYNITPVEGAYSGELLVLVNATDFLSGVDSVWVTLIHKVNETEYPFEAVYNATLDLFVATYDTIALNMTDGQYDISALVTDVVGLTDYDVIDPIIDNTPPEVSYLNVPTDMCVGATFTIGWEITDVWAGVCIENGEWTLPNGTSMDLPTSGAYTPMTAGVGNYTLNLTALDCAVPANVMDPDVTVYEINVSEECPETPSNPGGSGTGGNGGTTTTTETQETPESDAQDYVTEYQAPPPAEPEPEPEPQQETPPPQPQQEPLPEYTPGVIEQPPEPKFPWLAVILTALGLAFLLVGLLLVLLRKRKEKK
ncbi:LamG domain-containing protein [Nanoarchaeota archaeon]